MRSKTDVIPAEKRLRRIDNANTLLTRTLQLSEDLRALKQVIDHLDVGFDATNEVGALQVRKTLINHNYWCTVRKHFLYKALYSGSYHN
jgi:hypothetical protein